MAKKTNSLIFRFGLSILWNNKSNNDQWLVNKIKLENLLCKELQKKKIKVLFIQYKKYNINIFIYNFLGKQEFLKTQIMKYFNKVSNLEKIVNKFGVSNSIVQWFLKGENIKKGIKTQKNFIVVDKITLFYKKVFRRIIIIQLKNHKFFIFGQIFWILKVLKILEQKTIFCSYNKDINFKIIIKRKFRKISGLIKFKLFTIYLETLIFRYCHYFLKVILHNILAKKGLVMIHKIDKKYQQKNFSFVFHTILLGITYMNTKIITDYLSAMIETDRNHKKILKNFIKIVEKVFFSNTINLKGFQLRVSGKLNGKMRKSKYRYSLGKVQLQTIKLQLSYSMGISYTKFGILSIKIWLLNGNN